MEQSRKIDFSSRNKIVEVLLRNGEFFLFGFVFNVGNRLIEAFVFVYAVKENISSVSFVIVGFFVAARMPDKNNTNLAKTPIFPCF